jgi:hypothetical protein
MGCSLRKVHQLLSPIHAQNHSKASAQPDLPDNCNIRTTTRSRLFAPPNHMEVQGFVSKKERLEKMYPRWLPGFRYYSKADCPLRPSVILTCSSLYRPERRSIPAGNAIPSGLDGFG